MRTADLMLLEDVPEEYLDEEESDREDFDLRVSSPIAGEIVTDDGDSQRR